MKITIDDHLLELAKQASHCTTDSKTIETALRLLIAVNRQKLIQHYKGKLKWEGHLSKMRTDKKTKQLTSK